MKSTSLTLVGCRDHVAQVALEAARAEFAGCASRAAATLAAAREATTPLGGELLILQDPTAEEVTGALAALDALQLPRFTPIICGTLAAMDGAEVIPAEQWTVPVVGRALRSAAVVHGLRRENARFRGDLKAIGVRVAHDLRAPLSGILTSAEVLKEVLADSPPDDASLARTIVESAEDLKKIIQQMSLLAKASSHTGTWPAVDMGQAVSPAIGRLEGKAAKKGATFSQPVSWPAVAGDVTWLDAIWTNLATNALNHSGPAPQIELGWAPEGDEFHFWVADRGPALAAEKQRLLFQPLNLLHQPNSARGFGLPVVQRLVELQGGRCGYAPGPQGGSRFSFWLPVPRS